MPSFRKVYLVDDDVSARGHISRSLLDRTFDVRPFYENDFLNTASDLPPGCAVVDILHQGSACFLPLEAAAQQRGTLPPIAMCETCTVQLAVTAIKRGAVDVYEKRSPLDELISMITETLAALPAAVEKDAARRYNIKSLLKLTAREFRVLELVAAGHLSKTLAYVLGISTRTVDMHRQSLIKRLNVENMAKAIQMMQSVSAEQEIIQRSYECSRFPPRTISGRALASKPQ